MSESLGNIYDRSVAIVLEIVETCFLTKYFSKSYIYVFFLSKKQQNWFQRNSHNSGLVGHEKQSDPSLYNVFNLLWIGFRYILSFKWYDFCLKYLVTGQSPKFKTSVRNFPISETGSKCNLTTDSDLVIIMELKRKIKFSCACTF